MIVTARKKGIFMTRSLQGLLCICLVQQVVHGGKTGLRGGYEPSVGHLNYAGYQRRPGSKLGDFVSAM
jgi:hypothetical protein